MKLTDRAEYSAASRTDLIHIVVTGNTSQNPAGSSYKIPLQKVIDLFVVTGSSNNIWTTGSTGQYSIKANNLTTGIDATGDYAVSEGNGTLAYGLASHAEGNQTSASTYSHSEGQFTKAIATTTHAEGYQTTASGFYAHAEGYQSTASGETSHAEGYQTVAGGIQNHAEGDRSRAFGQTSHAEGELTTASGSVSHSEGSQTTASGNYSHAEGNSTTALGIYSHAGGNNSIASGSTSFVHGQNSVVGGSGSSILGNNITGTTANTLFVNTLALSTIRNYVNDAGADADATLASGGLYTLSASTGRAVYRKP